MEPTKLKPVAMRTQKLQGEATIEMCANALEMEREGRDIVRIEIGDPDFATPDHIPDAAGAFCAASCVAVSAVFCIAFCAASVVAALLISLQPSVLSPQWLPSLLRCYLLAWLPSPLSSPWLPSLALPLFPLPRTPHRTSLPLFQYLYFTAAHTPPHFTASTSLSLNLSLPLFHCLYFTASTSLRLFHCLCQWQSHLCFTVYGYGSHSFEGRRDALRGFRRLAAAERGCSSVLAAHQARASS